MADTRSVTPQDFWPLFETWAKTRITPGVLALPHGWAEWAISDFLGHSQMSSDGPAFDITRSLHLLRGRDQAVLRLNRDHPDAQSYALVLRAQPSGQSGRDFTAAVEQEFNQLAHGGLNPAAGNAIPVVLALCRTADSPADLKRAGFQRHFSLPVGGETLTSLSRRVRFSTPEGLTRWPETIAPPAEAFLVPTGPQSPPSAAASVADEPSTGAPAPPASPFSQLFRQTDGNSPSSGGSTA